MNEERTEPSPPGTRMRSLRRHGLAALVLLICAYLLFHLLFHLVIFLATIAAIVVAVIGAIWAIHTLF
jgi:Flp pilus assembly protein TadB